jgi:hypothetical protein
MRMLQAILGHQRTSPHPIRNKILPKIQNPLRHLSRPLRPIRIPIPTPAQFRKRSSARPHL